MERLRQYIAWVKGTLRPVMSPEAEHVLQGYWHMARAAAGKQAVRSTVRMLESLVRIAQVTAWPILSSHACEAPRPADPALDRQS